MIASLLIANRGEIACRIIRTARAMGIRTVAVYSDADAKALHVRQADEAVHIGPSPARESYLVGDKIIAAATATGAEAIHPGYGFLSENADFAQAVIDAGLIWVGPRPDSIRAMGLKDAAKALMAAAGVPVTPGYLGADQSPEILKAEAEKIGFPILIKAVAGGGGKGMRRVDAAAEFDDALDSCKREAAASFGNDVVLLEKYILSPRHIEVQVFGDSHGNVVHLFERDCSLQRRHQKVIEEAPAPGMDEATREQLCCAAIRAAKAVDYVGAGTIEFIADASQGLRADRIWFMEMNTRLQVEHCVTEEITGVDLVEWQLRVASGEKLPLRQDELSINGWAIEARLYAEDPAREFLPSIGRLEHFYLCDYYETDRIETGVEEGDDVSPFYDPMIAKLISAGDSREETRKNLINVIERSYVWPIKTNAGFLVECLAHDAFAQSDLSTNFIAAHEEGLRPLRELSDAAAEDGLSKLISEYPHKEMSHYEHQSGPNAFRLNRERQDIAVLYDGAQALKTRFRPMWSGPPNGRGHAYPVDEDNVIVVERGQTFRLSVRAHGGTVGAAAGDGAILAPMPGKVTSVEVAAGDSVTKGQRLLTLEAMKMEHGLIAPFDGVVAELNAEAGAQVAMDAVLAIIEPNGSPA